MGVTQHVDLKRYRYFDAPTPLPLAHRGGARYGPNEGIENSLAAFHHAADLGYRYMETDVHSSADGAVYAFHDETLERLTGDPAAIADLSSPVVDAARLSGREPIPRMQDLFESLPDVRFNIDIKADSAVDPTLDLVRRMGAIDRVCFASFSHERLQRIRSQMPAAASSFSPKEVTRLKLGRGTIGAYGVRHGGVCVQVPHRHGRITVVTPGFVRRAHRLGLQVHVWTIDDEAEMKQLLDMGVDGLVSDRIDVLKEVLTSRGLWRDPS